MMLSKHINYILPIKNHDSHQSHTYLSCGNASKLHSIPIMRYKHYPPAATWADATRKHVIQRANKTHCLRPPFFLNPIIMSLTMRLTSSIPLTMPVAPPRCQRPKLAVIDHGAIVLHILQHYYQHSFITLCHPSTNIRPATHLRYDRPSAHSTPLFNSNPRQDDRPTPNPTVFFNDHLLRQP